jgi:hypothetical protein
MTAHDPYLDALARARDAGRHDDTLHLLLGMLAENDASARPSRLRHFATMFGWQMLVERHAPARAALAAARDEQVRRLFANDPQYGRDDREPGDDPGEWPWRPSRFEIAVAMNEILDDERATWRMFARLAQEQPACARQQAWRALRAVVACGDFALADRFRGDPLATLDAVNLGARTHPLYPGRREAPRLSADLSNLVRAVAIALAVLEGTGRGAEAAALRARLLGGLESPELRAMAARELDEPGAITRAVVEHQMAQDERSLRA